MGRIVERSKAWAAKNPEKYKEMRRAIDARRVPKRRQWEAENAERLAEYARKRYQENKKTVNERNAAWKRSNSEKVRAYNQARRALARCAEGRFTDADIEALHVEQNGLCVYCRTPLTKYHVDHVVPLALGGSNWPTNLQLLCVSCNSRKGAKHPSVFAAMVAATCS